MLEFLAENIWVISAFIPNSSNAVLAEKSVSSEIAVSKIKASGFLAKTRLNISFNLQNHVFQ